MVGSATHGFAARVASTSASGCGTGREARRVASHGAARSGSSCPRFSIGSSAATCRAPGLQAPDGSGLRLGLRDAVFAQFSSPEVKQEQKLLRRTPLHTQKQMYLYSLE